MPQQSLNLFKIFRFPVGFVVLLWVFHIYKITYLKGYPSLGIYPRELFGLQGILTSPLSHGDFQHLISNSLPLLMTMTVIFWFYKRVAITSFLMIYILTGAAVWCFARPVFHIGASGIVYGLISFIFWTGIFRRNNKSIILSLVIVVMYSGYFYGIVPNQDGISWESHLFGAIVGVNVAFILKDLVEPTAERVDPWINESDDVAYYFSRDQFEYTKAQRIAMREEERREAQRLAYLRSINTADDID